MRLLLAKKRGSPRRFHSRAELKCSRSPRLEKWLDHSCLAQLRFSRFYLVSKHFALTLLASTSLSFVSQLSNLSIFLFFPLSPAFSFRNDKDHEMIYATRTSSFVFQIYVFRQEKIFTYVPKLTTFVKQSFYKVSIEFNILCFFIHIIFMF